MDFEDDGSLKRYKNNVDTYNLLPGDGCVESPERSIIGEVIYLEMLRCLETDRDRFIAICLADHFTKADIAYMLHIDPAIITRRTKEIRIKLLQYGKVK